MSSDVYHLPTQKGGCAGTMEIELGSLVLRVRSRFVW